jgi:hypothetical protein
MLCRNINEGNCQDWLRETLPALPQGLRIIDVGVIVKACKQADGMGCFGWHCVAVKNI